MSRAVLHELLDSGLRYAPEYRGGLSNHLPMALGALHALGADDDRLRDFFDRYSQRLGSGAPSAGTLADWTAGLGRVEAFADLFTTFRSMLDQEGTAQVLRRVLPRLMCGVGAAAFHGLIRTAYGVAAQHDGETAAGLAYWACRHLPLDAPAVPAADQLCHPAAWLGALAGDLMGLSVEGELIFERMRVVAGAEAFARHAGRLAIDESTLAALADFAAQRYAATRNFTVLHLVTSCHAMRVLLPWLDRNAALRDYARAYAAGCIASGIDLRASLLPRPTPGWPQVVQRAVVSNDDHVIKLVHSCREEAQAHGDGARLHAAGLAVGG